MRILITGAGGMLGSDLRKTLAPEHEIIATGVESGLTRMDITDRARVIEVMVNYTPNLVIHCAAYADVDGCEKNPLQSARINEEGTVHVAQASEAVGAPLVFISTDYVFDGCKETPYTEDDIANPLSVYALHKYRAEAAVKKLSPAHYIVRTAWLYGANGVNFPSRILEKARQNQPLKVVNDQIGSPTFTCDLADALAKLITLQPAYGIYHLVNAGQASRYEMAQFTLQTAALDPSLEPISSGQLNAPAQRPAYSVLDTGKAAALGITLRDWRTALAEFIQG